MAANFIETIKRIALSKEISNEDRKLLNNLLESIQQSKSIVSTPVNSKQQNIFKHKQSANISLIVACVFAAILMSFFMYTATFAFIAKMNGVEGFEYILVTSMGPLVGLFGVLIAFIKSRLQ